MEHTEAKDADVQVRRPHRMVDRVAAILELVARAPDGLTLTELAKALAAPVSSTQGLVNGLVSTGYIDERDRRYTLGTAPYLLNLIAGRHMVSHVRHDDLQALQEETGFTALLSIAVGSDIFYIDHSSTEARYAYLVENYVRRSLIRTSAGWVLMADLPQRDLWAYLKSLPAEDNERIELFLAALPQIRETGICASPHSSDIADGVSIAVRNSGRTIAAVGVVGPSEQIESERDRLATILEKHSHSWRHR